MGGLRLTTDDVFNASAAMPSPSMLETSIHSEAERHTATVPIDMHRKVRVLVPID